MRIIRYNLLHKTPGGSGILLPKELPHTEENIAIAEDEAYNGEYFIEDDGVEEVTTPSQLDIIEAQVTYTAMMTNTLLEAE